MKGDVKIEDNNIYNLIELFNFKEGTEFITNFDNSEPEIVVYIEKGLLYFIDEFDEYDKCNNICSITDSWLKSTFIKKHT